MTRHVYVMSMSMTLWRLLCQAEDPSIPPPAPVCDTGRSQDRASDCSHSRSMSQWHFFDMESHGDMVRILSTHQLPTITITIWLMIRLLCQAEDRIPPPAPVCDAGRSEQDSKCHWSQQHMAANDWWQCFLLALTGRIDCVIVVLLFVIASGLLVKSFVFHRIGGCWQWDRWWASVWKNMTFLQRSHMGVTALALMPQCGLWRPLWMIWRPFAAPLSLSGPVKV